MAYGIEIKTASLPVKPTGTLVIYSADGGKPEGEGAAIWGATGLDWKKVTDAAGFKGKQGQMLDILAPEGVSADRLLVLGSGKPAESEAIPTTAWTDRGGSLAGKLLGARVERAAVIIDSRDATPARLAEVAAGLPDRPGFCPCYPIRW